MDVREVEGRLRPACPACGWIAYEHLKVGAAVLLEREGKLLLAQRAPDCPAFPGTWYLPAGYCEADEPPSAAAAREALEEVGLAVQVGRLSDAYYFDDDPRGNGLLLVYEARAAEGDPLPAPARGRAAGEIAAAGFFPPDGLPRPLCGAGHDRAIRAWQARALDRWRPGTAPRYCPHCTHPLEERPVFGRVRPACPACGFVHLRELKVGVSLVVEEGGRILLVQRAWEPEQGKWSLPSGFVEWDESPEAAARRECLEETGLVAGDLALVRVNHYTDDWRGPGINLIYRTRPAAGTLQAGDDAAGARFLLPSELPPEDEIAFAGHRELIREWRAGAGSPDALRVDGPIPIPMSNPGKPDIGRNIVAE
jgi:8-oxo-dGTP diphosphatase